MADNYSVIFRGDIVLGKNLVEVKQKLAQLFKVDDARIERMFTGKPTPLKANIALAQAKKYQSILTQAGIVTEIIDATTATKKSPSKASPKVLADKVASKTSENKPVKESTVDAGFNFSLAPVGSDLLEGKREEVPEPIIVDHISLAEQQGNIVGEEERLAPLPATVDADELEWDLTEVGEDLLKPSEHKEVETSDLNTDNISLAATGGELLTHDEKKVVEDANIDTSHIKIITQ